MKKILTLLMVAILLNPSCLAVTFGGNETKTVESIYYGILFFFSNILKPFFILIAIIFLVLVILAIGRLIKAITE